MQRYFVLLLLNLACGKVFTAPTTPTQPPIPSGAEKCTQTRKLEVLPGRGWDSLQELALAQAIDMNYSLCKTTDDGAYLIPDSVYAIPVKTSDVQLDSEIVEKFTDYRSLTAKSFGVSAGYGPISASFSAGFRKAKEQHTKSQSKMIRVQMRNTRYRVGLETATSLTPTFKALLMNAFTALQVNDTQMADYILEYIVRDYGTHYVKTIDAGAVLVKDDYFNSNSTKKNDESSVTASASASFFGLFSFGASYSQTDSHSSSTGQAYTALHTVAQALGGSPLSVNVSAHDWLSSVPDNLVAVDHSGEPLHYLITPSAFPDASTALLDSLRKKLQQTVAKYYSINTHLGCTDVHSRNFDFAANLDDGSCNVSSTFGKLFGGMYQKCTPISSDGGNMCEIKQLDRKHPETNDYRCPEPSLDLPLLSNEEQITTHSQQCQSSCKGWWIFKKCYQNCQTVFHSSTVSIRAYWCVAPEGSVLTHDVKFGGLYTSQTVNSVTKQKQCPPYFIDYPLGKDLRVCLSTDELAGKYAINFGGFFSCLLGNPLASTPAGGRIQAVGDPYHHSCPPSYVQHTAAIDNNCVVSYCEYANPAPKHPPLVRPPFTDSTELMYAAAVQQPLTSDGTVEVYAPGSGSGGHLTTEAIVAISVGSAILILMVMGGGIFWRRKKNVTNSENRSGYRRQQ